MIPVSLPVPQEEVAKTIHDLELELRRLEIEKKTIMNIVHAVQDNCTHPDVTGGNTWGRWPFTKCTVCGKEW